MSRHGKHKKHRGATVIALDASFIPMVEIERRKALKALATGRAHALDLATWGKLGICDVAGKPFQVVVFPNAKAVNEAKLGAGRGFRSIYRRDGHRCQYCGGKGDSLDHITPKAQGGKSTATNLCVACRSCNSRKGPRTPEQAGMPLLRPIRGPKAFLMERFLALVDEAKTA